MLDTETYLKRVRADGERIAEVSAGNLELPVPTCPGNTVASLLLHTTGVFAFWTGALEQNRRPDFDMARLEGAGIDTHQRELERFLAAISVRDPDEPIWTFGSEQTVRFWCRRSAHEMSVHRWDFENAVGEPQPIDPALAADGIDELLIEFGTKRDDGSGWISGSEMFGGDGETFCLQASDGGGDRLVTARPDRFDVVTGSSPADVTARGTASDLLLFCWGRVPPDALEVVGDASLLERWQERVRI